MTCRHNEGDSRCTSGRSAKDLYEKGKRLVDKWGPKIGLGISKPDSEQYQILDTFINNEHLVLKVKYPSCPSCAYEGIKIMVFCGVSLADAIKWTRIDPHFRDPKLKSMSNEAPAPIARFPGNNRGWESAIKFIKIMG